MLQPKVKGARTVEGQGYGAILLSDKKLDSNNLLTKKPFRRWLTLLTPKKNTT